MYSVSPCCFLMRNIISKIRCQAEGSSSSPKFMSALPKFRCKKLCLEARRAISHSPNSWLESMRRSCRRRVERFESCKLSGTVPMIVTMRFLALLSCRNTWGTSDRDLISRELPYCGRSSNFHRPVVATQSNISRPDVFRHRTSRSPAPIRRQSSRVDSIPTTVPRPTELARGLQAELSCAAQSESDL